MRSDGAALMRCAVREEQPRGTRARRAAATRRMLRLTVAGRHVANGWGRSLTFGGSIAVYRPAWIARVGAYYAAHAAFALRTCDVPFVFVLIVMPSA